jgi:Arc/MetJ family transcription regulator
MKMINLKNEKDEVRRLYKRHLRIDIKRYLKRIFKKPTHLFPSEGF